MKNLIIMSFLAITGLANASSSVSEFTKLPTPHDIEKSCEDAQSKPLYKLNVQGPGDDDIDIKPTK